jgi:hypothetical protein
LTMPATLKASPIYTPNTVAAHRTAWLRDAEATVRVLDWRAFTDGRTFHVIDGREIGMPDKGFAGLVAGAQLHELARDYIPRTARHPVAAVAVQPDVVARMTVGLFHADAAEAIPLVRAAIAAIAAHEYAHVVADRVAGVRLPSGATLDQIISSLSGRVSEPGHRAKSHGPQWCRAYAHMVTRAASMRHHDEWVKRLRGDIEATGVGSADAMLDALHPELVRYTADDQLEDILHTPAPAGFLELFPKEVMTHGSDS